MRQRKDSFVESGYLLSEMDTLSISPELTVSELLQKHPETQQVFISQQTACIGCTMARFCSMKDVSLSYDLKLDMLLSELRRSIRQQNQKTKEFA